MKAPKGKLFKKCLVMLFIFIIISYTGIGGVSSSDESCAQALSKLGVFVGTGSGFELSRAPTRVEGVVMLIRLLGAEKDALSMTRDTLPFTDVPDWAKGYVAYAYKNKLTNGVSDTVFGTQNIMDAKMYSTFLLRSLGYRDAAGDFSYSKSIEFAYSLGLLEEGTYDELQNSTFLRAHIARLSCDTLRFPIKGSETILIDKLTADGKISQTTAGEFLKTVIDTSGKVRELSVAEIAKNTKSVVMIACEKPEGTFQGSGVVLKSDGTIVTNCHVLEGASKIEVYFDDKTSYTGNVYIEDYDYDLDLAVIKIDKTNLKAATVGDSSKIVLGEKVVAIGSPIGLFNTVSEGIISLIWQNELQTTAPISHGSSGGGLFNMQGELVGITYAGITEGENLGFVIPVNKLSYVSGKQKLSLAAFNQGINANTLKDAAQNTVPAPGNIRIAKEDDVAIYL